jgi:glucan phosphoethanolaminetransferase (alkaline phosphatase superfamily)
MKNTLRVLWTPLAYIVSIILLGLSLIIFRNQLPTAALYCIVIALCLLIGYFCFLLYKSLAHYEDSVKLRKTMRQIDPYAQELHNVKLRAAHKASFISNLHSGLFFFGSHEQCAVYAPDYKRAAKFYHSLDSQLQEAGGQFYYRRAGILKLVK